MDGRTYAPNEWGDPDSLRDILPQPFRFIDRCVPVPVTPCSSRCATVPQAHQTACFPLNVPKDTMGLAIDMRGFFRIQPELAVHTARPTLAAPSMRVAASAHSCLREIVETAIGIASDTDAKRRHASISRYL